MPIVDDNDNIIGSKDRAELDYSKDIYRSTALWVYNSRDEVLIAQRKFTKARQPGKWGPSAAGTVENNESYDENAHKEAEEELGIKDVVLEPLKKLRTDDEVHQFTQWYAVEIDQADSYFVPQPDEVEKVSWVGINDLIQDYKNQPSKYVSSMNICLEVLQDFKSNKEKSR